ncbi:MAG: ATP-binding protein [candidate division Zixibacteria bacterium]|nr:ATP-binding protein [candidate division Zixibacteria bacterium]
MNPANKGRSPFYPGQPVPVQLFVGREAQIDRVRRAGSQVAAGKPQAVFIAGEYGIGKSSLAHYLHALLDIEQSLYGLHVLLGGAKTLADLAAKTVEAAILSKPRKQSALGLVRNVLADYVGEQELLGVKIRLDKLRADSADISRGYLPFLRQIHQSILKDSYKGLILILDEINGIASNPDFSQFIKTLVDSNALSSDVGSEPLPLLLILCGVEARRKAMIQTHQPVERIFDVVAVDPMSPSESASFFEKAFKEIGMSVEPGALSTLVRFTGGLPKLMHLVGDAAFWTAKGERLTESEATTAVLDAADDIGRRYLDQQVIGALQSTDYRGILKKLGKMTLSLSFKKNDLDKLLTPTESKKLGNFLRRMKDLNVIRGTQYGEYTFNDWLTRIYIMMKASPPNHAPSG